MSDLDLSERLGRAVPAGLRDRLHADATTSDLADVTYRTIDSPVGPLLLAATPVGLLRVAFACENHDTVLQRLAERVSPRVLAAPARLDPAARQLADYFAGRRTGFDLVLDLRLTTGFRQRVLRHLQQIGYGRTETYREVATAAGSPRAVRAVGSACATNPVPLVVPCHRVLRTGGALGGYRGGLAAKQALLDFEAQVEKGTG